MSLVRSTERSPMAFASRKKTRSALLRRCMVARLGSEPLLVSDRTKASACAALISVTLLTLDVQAPQSQAEYDRIADDYDLRLETLSARRRGVSMMQPKLRQKLDREFMSVAAEKAAYTTAYAVQAEQKAMAAYESSPMAKEQK